jgi:hypothetical protein
MISAGLPVWNSPELSDKIRALNIGRIMGRGSNKLTAARIEKKLTKPGRYKVNAQVAIREYGNDRLGDCKIKAPIGGVGAV